MIGLGTAINIGLIIAGSLCGLAFGRFMKENLKQTLMMVSGIIVLLLGMSGAMQYMLVIVNGTLQTTGPLLMIISMVAGAIIGEIIDLNRWITVFGDWVKARTGNAGDPKFTHAFITASLTFTVGAMGVLGSIQDGLTGNSSTVSSLWLWYPPWARGRYSPLFLSASPNGLLLLWHTSQHR